MAQDFGPAQPIYDVAKRAYDRITSITGKPAKKEDDTKKYAADPKDVEAATKSFRDGADAAKTTSRKVSATSKSTPAKSQVRKVSTSRKYIDTKR